MKFGKEDRSTWKYFWAHWCAFQMTALNLRVWRPKHLLHDWYKPWLKTFGWKYERIQKLHRNHSKHHLEYLERTHDAYRFDWLSMIIDWECSQYTKKACPLNAYQKMNSILETSENDYVKVVLRTFMEPKLKELGLS